MTGQSGKVLTAAGLTAALRRELAGGGSGEAAGDGSGEAAVVLWHHHTDQLLLHTGELTAEPLPAGVQIRLPLQTDQTGRAELTVSFALARAGAQPDLAAVSAQLPSGDPVLAHRWGRQLQDTLFEALLRVLDRAAAEAGRYPLGLRAGEDGLELAFAGPVTG